MTRNIRAFATATAVMVFVGGLVWWAVGRWESTDRPVAAAVVPSTPAASYVGSGQCASCHAGEHASWLGSQHQRAMQHAGPGTVRGNFDDASFSHAGVTSRFVRRDDRYFILTDGPDGQLAEFEVKYTFGVEPLQQYLVELPGGRLQAVSIAWDTRLKEEGGQRWFHIYPGETIDHRDELHWTRGSQNWNFMCADCHSTELRKGYDAATGSYHTRYAEISVGCEACHGPGSAHLEWASRPASGAGPAVGDKGLVVLLDERRGVSWSADAASGKPRRSVARTSEREIEVCAQCHSRRAQLADGYEAGRPFLDYYQPALLTSGLYHADGQQHDEVYVWGSWLQSRMHNAGVTCSDCHDPHSQELRVPGNAVCGQCHATATYEAAAHHHHATGSAGSQCVACHMPRREYMVVDPRRDHSLRVPRPDQSVALGVPNACNGCHVDRDAQWAAAAVHGWLGRNAAGYQSFAEAFAAADAGEGGAAERLSTIAQDAEQPAIVRASALARLEMGEVVDPELARRAVADPAPLVRLASIGPAAALPPALRAQIVAPLLTDANRTIRIEAARVLAGDMESLAAATRPALQSSSDEYLATLRYNSDRPEASVALGGFHAARGQVEEARRAFERAILLAPEFVPAYVNEADMFRNLARESEAAQVLEEGIARVPHSAALHHSLGLTRVRMNDTGSALRELKLAVDLAPDSARYTYVYAVALHSTGSPGEAVALLERATARWPNDRDMLVALASFQLGLDRRDAARETVRRLIAAHPSDADAQALAADVLGPRQR